MIDSTILGGLLTGTLGLMGAALAKAKCFVRCLPEENGKNVPSCGCGFTDARLLPDSSKLEKHEINENDLLLVKRTQ